MILLPPSSLPHRSQKCHVNQLLVDGLTILQHRGQGLHLNRLISSHRILSSLTDAAGIVTWNKGRLHLLKNSGTVHDVFTQSNISDIPGPAGIGHVRYPTAGGSCISEAQPLYTNSPFGIACAHNGNLTNSAELTASMLEDMRHINTNSDTELLLNTFAEELQRKRLRQISPDEIFDTVRSVMRRWVVLCLSLSLRLCLPVSL
jgi:amidophosphoribosyltransferase